MSIAGQMDYEQVVEDMEMFLRTFKDDEGDLPYWSKIQVMSLDESISIHLNYEHLANYDFTLSTLLMADPKAFLKACNQALTNILEQEDGDYLKSLGHEVFNVRIRNIPNTTSIRHVRSEHVGKFIQVQGNLMSVRDPEDQMVEGMFVCVCDELVIQRQEHPLKMQEPVSCPVCGKKKWRLDLENSIMIDRQDIRIQETQETLEGAQKARDLVVILYRDLVDRAAPGSTVRITGIMKRIPRSLHGQNSLRFTRYLEATDIEVMGEDFDAEISEKERESIIEMSKDPDVFQKIRDSICPVIWGWDDVKEAVALLLFGGTERKLPDGSILRGAIHVLLPGDFSTGKSQILRWVSSLISRGVYASGSGSSRAGLTAAAVQDKTTGQWELEPGVLILADMGIACLDELEKMGSEDRKAIHTTMEQGVVPFHKANLHMEFKARTSVLAAANPVFGRYEDSISFRDNIDLDPALLSRFDIIYIMRDVIEETRDRTLARYSLQTASSNPPEGLKPPMSKDLLRKYILFAKKYVQPELNDEARKEIEDYYIKLRNASSEPNASVQIALRQNEALRRLTEARAKMGLRKIATREDALAAISLVDSSLRMVALDPTTGKIDIDKLVSALSQNQRSNANVILGLMSDARDEGRIALNDSDLIELAVSTGLTEDATKEVIIKLEKTGKIFRDKNGRLRLSEKKGA